MPTEEQTKQQRNFIIECARTVCTELFMVSLVTYLLLYIIENVFPKTVSIFINLDTFAIVTIVFAVLAAFSMRESDVRGETVWEKKYFYATVVVMALLCAWIVYYKLKGSGALTYAAAAGTLLFVVVTSITVLGRENKN